MSQNYKIVERLTKYRPKNEWGDGEEHVICNEAASLIQELGEALELARTEFATVATFSDMTTENNWIDMKGTINSRANQSFGRMNAILSKLKET